MSEFWDSPLIRSGCFFFCILGRMEEGKGGKGKREGDRLDTGRGMREEDAYRHVGLTADIGLC